MSLTIFLLAALAGSASCEWDLAVLTSTSLELLGHETMSPVSSTPLGITDISALTYDPLYLHHYFAATGHPNASIFRVQVSRDGRVGPIEPLIKKQPGKVYSLAYDAESTTVFWTASKHILRSQLDLGLTDGEVIHSFDENEKPLAIAVEPCKRYIYWSYRMQFIDRSLMDGTNKERVVVGLFIPIAITISQAERRIYWVDEGPGYSFRIGRALLDGSNKETILEDTHQQPTSLVVMPAPSSHGSIVYWTDKTSNKLWSLQENSSLPEPMKEYNNPVYAVASADSFKKLDKHVCSQLIVMRDQVPYSAISPTVGACVHGTFSVMSTSCVCTPGYIGTLCETSICYNYCLSGTCSMPEGKPTCRCPPGRMGKRCEINVCHGYCHMGKCDYTTGKPICTCDEGWLGNRCNMSVEYCTFVCENRSSNEHGCNCSATVTAAASAALRAPSADQLHQFKLMFYFSAGGCAVLALVVVVLLATNCKLSRRPRIRKMYRVTPHKGSAPQPAKTSPDCEIAIENCCNMNICETPCYEPELRPPSGRNKKEEKRGLLREMEVQPDSGKTF